MPSLPSFAEPPVRRVSIGIVIDGASSTVAQLFAFCSSRLLSEYPNQHEHAAEEPYRETPWGETPSIQINLGSLMGASAPPNLQLHCLTADLSWGIKLQRDWVQVIWNRSSDEADYPRWPAVRKRAEEAMTAFFDEYGGHAAQVEVQYSNTVGAGAAAKVVSTEFAGAALGPMESLQLHSHHQLEFDSSKARLHLDVSPSPASKELQLSLTVRGRAGQGTPAEALAFADAAREHIVTGFADITSEEFHNKWGKQ